MSANLIGWIVTIVFVVFLIAGFFIGFWRGLKRSTASAVMSLVGVVVAFFITPLIANNLLALTIDVNGELVPLRELAVHLLAQEPDIAALMVVNPNIKTLALALPGAIINAVLFIFVTLVVELILYVIYKILAHTVLKNKPGKKKNRLWGGAIGLVKTFIVVLFAFMPLSSLVGLASSMLGTTATNQASAAERVVETQQEETILSENIPPVAANIINGFESSVLVKCCGVFGLDNAMFDYYSKVQIENETVVLRTEVSNIYQTANAVFQISDAIQNGTGIAHVNYNSLSTLFNDIVDGPLFKTIISETLGGVLTNPEQQDMINQIPFMQENPEIIETIAGDLEKVKEETGSYHQYFSTDLKTLFSVFRSMGESGLLDGAMAIEEGSIENVLAYLTNDDNIDTFAGCILKAFDAKMFRAAAKPVVAMALPNIMPGADEIGVSTTSWTDEQWNASAQGLVDIISMYGDISQEIAITDVLPNPMKLIDTTENFDLPTITSDIGKLIDALRKNNLLKTSEDKPVIDAVLEDANLTLPAEEVSILNEDGTISKLEIENYQQLFGFIAPALELLRDEDVLDILTAPKAVENLAAKISEDGNEDLLLDIILPLNQIALTKDIIKENLDGAVGNGFLNMSVLNTYDEWKTDLEYISAMLTTLHGKTTILEGESVATTYLQLVVDSQLEELVNAMLPTDVEEIFTPLLYAKSTASLKGKMLDQIYATVSEITDTTLSAPTAAYTFEKDNAEDQTSEFISITQGLLAVSKTYDGSDIGSVNRTLLGTTLEAMKYNAYRTTLMQKTQAGVFATAFDAIMTKFKTDYNFEIEIGLPFLEAQGDSKAGQYYDKLTENRYSEINYNELMAYLAEKEEILNSIPQV